MNLAITLKSIGDAVIATDLERKIIFMKTAAEYLTKWKNTEAMGKKINEVFKIICAETGNKVKEHISNVLEKGASFYFALPR
ncbi:PAS domain-containing protein [Candidatus Riflebacteria bacterium]